MKRYALIAGMTHGTVQSTHTTYAAAQKAQAKLLSRQMGSGHGSEIVSLGSEDRKAKAGGYWNGSRFFGPNESVG